MSNELGDCKSVIEDIITLLADGGIICKKMCIYCSKEDKGYISDYYGNIGLQEFSIIERGSLYNEYVIHYVAFCDDCVIDPNFSNKINSSEDLVFEFSDYKSLILNANKTRADRIRFIIK